MTTTDAFIAANRFGLGPDRNLLAKITADPRAWLLAQLGPDDGAAPFLKDLPTSDQMIAEHLKIRRSAITRKKFNKERAGPLYRKEILRRTIAAIHTDTPFRERLVHFWSNHFTVSTTVGRLRPIVGAFEREAIRPHVTGKFADMLIAVTKHPVMLIYLDNIQSIGPNSVRGLRTGRGLNENLAREILELHTLGVGGGYRQKDVTEFARILTGWRFGGTRFVQPGQFAFLERWHEPGEKSFLGQTYQEDGMAEGIAALRTIAAHPSTAKFIATKLARHFIADDPPHDAIDNLRRVFLESDGDLAALARTLVEMPQSWRAPLAKTKTPNELSISTFKLLGIPTKQKQVLYPLRLLGQMPFRAPSPAGWPDDAASWISPESLLRRIEIMQLAAKRYGKGLDPRQLADAAFGPVASAATTSMIRRAESREEALALLLASPEFQRR
jgi:uncharacterized protein (DUF1800 family)